MDKPINLRQKTWDWIRPSLANLPKTEIQKILEQPGSWLLDHGLLDRPEMLRDTVIVQEPDAGPDCLIDELAAQALSMGLKRVTVFRLGDNKPVIMTRAEIERSLRESWVFDQLN